MPAAGEHRSSTRGGSLNLRTCDPGCDSSGVHRSPPMSCGQSDGERRPPLRKGTPARPATRTYGPRLRARRLRWYIPSPCPCSSRSSRRSSSCSRSGPRSVPSATVERGRAGACEDARISSRWTPAPSSSAGPLSRRPGRSVISSESSPRLGGRCSGSTSWSTSAPGDRSGVGSATPATSTTQGRCASPSRRGSSPRSESEVIYRGSRPLLARSSSRSASDSAATSRTPDDSRRFTGRSSPLRRRWSSSQGSLRATTPEPTAEDGAAWGARADRLMPADRRSARTTSRR